MENATQRNCGHYYCDSCNYEALVRGKCLSCESLFRAAMKFVHPGKEADQKVIDSIIKKEGIEVWNLAVEKAKLVRKRMRLDAHNHPQITWLVHIVSKEYGIVGFSCFKGLYDAKMFALEQNKAYNTGNTTATYEVCIYKNIQGQIGTLGQKWETISDQTES